MVPARRLILAASLSLFALSATAAVRLTYPMGGAPTTLYWPASSFPIAYQIEPRVANVLGQAPVDRAFEAWAGVTGANVTFRATGVVDGTKTGKDGKNTVGLMDGLFKDQGFIAVTTYWSNDSGQLSEADIQLDPAYVGTAYPAQQTIQHEVGHLLGLDHSGVLSSIMYPFVCKDESTEFDIDDRISISNLYPKLDPTLTGATLTGRVVGNDGGLFAALVVAVDEAGAPVATGLTESTGEFVLEAVPAGNYRLYAEPLDGPVTPLNFSGVYRDAKVTSFPTRYLAGGPLHVDAGKVYGNLVIDTTGAPVQLNPKWIGVSGPDSTDFSLFSSVAALRAGQTVAIAVGGDGFTSGMTTFAITNPGVKRISEFRYAGNYVYANFEIAPDATPGSAVIAVTNGNNVAMLTGGVRISAAGSVPRPRVVRRS